MLTYMSHLTANVGGELDLLHSIGEQLESCGDQRVVVEPILELLATSLALEVAAITILDTRNKEAAIDASWGLSEKQQRQGRYRLGEGVTGQVIARGESVIVEHCADSDEFLDRTQSTDDADADYAFVCVPVRLEGA
jgi:Nif-specific regulatory protein